MHAERIRAARAFADLSQRDLADALGVDVQWVKRREKPRGEEGAQDPKALDRIAIAEVCGVPVDFLEHGFGGAARSEIAERLAGIESLLRPTEPKTPAEVLEEEADRLDARRGHNGEGSRRRRERGSG